MSGPVIIWTVWTQMNEPSLERWLHESIASMSCFGLLVCNTHPQRGGPLEAVAFLDKNATISVTFTLRRAAPFEQATAAYGDAGRQ